METYSLFELNQFIRQVFALNFQEQIWVRAEIAQSRQSKGHCYIELVEKSPDLEHILAQSSAVIWAGDYQKMKREIGDSLENILLAGSEIQCLVEIDYHVRYGLKFVIRNVDINYTLGRLELKRRQILERLHAENLVELNKRHKLPVVLQRIAIISSETAAGYKDFIHQLDNNSLGYKISHTLFSASMQGVNVSKDITRHLRLFDDHKYDCIVIIRGGGSKLDLSDFDDYEVAKTIALARLPVITGIGHEIDTSIADVVAHTSIKTPTAVAEFILNHNRSFEEQFIHYFNRILNFAGRKLNTHILELSNLKKSIKVQSKFKCAKQLEELANLRNQITKDSRHALSNQSQKLEFMNEKLQVLDFRNVLKRGYTITHKAGKIIRSVSDLSQKELITHMFTDGEVSTIVQKIDYGKKEK